MEAIAGRLQKEKAPYLSVNEGGEARPEGRYFRVVLAVEVRYLVG
jgi:hypothetical protein